MYNQNYQGLPHHTDKFEVQPWLYQTQPRVNIAPALQNFLPAIVYAVQRELSEKAGTNPMRVFYWNLCARNTFQNPEYEAVVQGVIDWISHALASGSINPNVPLDPVINEFSAKMVEYMCAAQIRKFPMLGSVFDQSRIARSLNEFDNLARVINAGQQQPLINQQIRPVSPAFTATGIVGQFGGQPQQTSIYQQQHRPSNSPSDFGSKEFDSAAFWTPEKQEPIPVTTTQQPAQVLQQIEVSMNQPISLDEAAKLWTPDTLYPYRPAYAPTKFKLEAIKNISENNKVVVSYQVQEGEIAMEEVRHVIKRTYDDKIDPDFYSPQLEDIQRNSQDLAAAIATISEEPNPLLPFQTVNSEIVEMQVGMDGGWAQGKTHLLKAIRDQVAQGKDVPEVSIIQWRSCVIEPIIANKREQDLIEVLQNADTVSKICNALEDLRANASPSVFHVIDRRVSAALNRMLKVSLSITGVEIETATKDLPELLDYLKAAYGKVADVVRANIRKAVYPYVRILSDLEKKAVLKEIYDLDDDQCGNEIAFFARDVLFTDICCDAQELDLAFESRTSSILTSRYTPAIEHLARVTVSENPTINQFLVRTLDGQVLEFSAAWLMNDAYLVSLVK